MKVEIEKDDERYESYEIYFGDGRQVNVSYDKTSENLTILANQLQLIGWGGDSVEISLARALPQSILDHLLVHETELKNRIPELEGRKFQTVNEFDVLWLELVESGQKLFKQDYHNRSVSYPRNYTIVASLFFEDGNNIENVKIDLSPDSTIGGMVLDAWQGNYYGLPVGFTRYSKYFWQSRELE